MSGKTMTDFQATADVENDAFFINLLQFVSLLRRAGLSISLEQTMDVCRALELIDLSRRSHVYYAMRGILVKRKEDIGLFDQLFARFWAMPVRENRQRGQTAPRAPRHDVPKKHPLSIATLMAQRARESDPAVDIADKTGSYSAEEVLRAKDFSTMTPEELAEVKKALAQRRWNVSMRRSRRFVPNRHGTQLDMRRVLRRAAHYGGTPLHLSWQSRKIKPRPLIILADISGSMEKYSRLLLQFCYSLTHRLNSVETFVFATRLSRITAQLRITHIDRAVDEAAQQVADWSGGTRIGASLHTFNREWSRRVLREGQSS